MKRISLITSDNKELEFDCGLDETVVDAAKRNGFYLQAQCNQGSCGSCLASTANKKNIKLSGYDKDILSEQDMESGKTLLCCTQVLDDVIFTLPYPRCLINDAEPQERIATISKINKLNHDTYHLLLQLDDHPEYGLSFDFEPGQFVQLTIPNADESRPYSLANSPGFTGELEFYIKLRDGGLFSNFLQNLASTGMKITVKGPLGSFMLHDNGIKHRLFIAGGCGLASIMSMLRRMVDWQEPHPITLLFGVWNDTDLFALDDIEKLTQLLPNINTRICINKITSKQINLPVHNGDILSAIPNLINLKDEQPDVYICGSSGLVNACKEFCINNKINSSNIYFEHFSPTQFKDKACTIR